MVEEGQDCSVSCLVQGIKDGISHLTRGSVSLSSSSSICPPYRTYTLLVLEPKCPTLPGTRPTAALLQRFTACPVAVLLRPAMVLHHLLRICSSRSQDRSPTGSCLRSPTRRRSCRPPTRSTSPGEQSTPWLSCPCAPVSIPHVRVARPTSSLPVPSFFC